MNFRVNRKENVYFGLKVCFTIVVLLALISLFSKPNLAMVTSLTVIIVYTIMIVMFVVFQKMYLIAHLKGNGIEISEEQFPEVYEKYKEMGQKLSLKKLPKLFLIQQGGLLNAFAVRFSGNNYIAIYSDVFSLVLSDLDSLIFILGHELGHVKRAHMSRRFWTFPSSIIPFLTPAYSRSCELTCDNIGFLFSEDKAVNGLVLLAAGKELYQKVDKQKYIEHSLRNNTAVVKFIGLFNSHPYLPKRLQNLNILQKENFASNMVTPVR